MRATMTDLESTRTPDESASPDELTLLRELLDQIADGWVQVRRDANGIAVWVFAGDWKHRSLVPTILAAARFVQGLKIEETMNERMKKPGIAPGR